MSCGQQITIKRPNHKHLASDITDFAEVVVAYSVNASLSSTSLFTNSAYWQETYNSVLENSACWNDACDGITTFQTNSGNYNSVYSSVCALSANWNTAFVQSSVFSQNSANYNYQGTDIKSLTANWQGTSNHYFTNSASYQSVYNSVCALSAFWNSNVDDEQVNSLVQNNSSYWQNTYVTVANNSAQWAIDADNGDVNTFVVTTSASILDANTTVRNNSAAWANTTNILYDSVYNTVNSNSAVNWNYQGTDVKLLTANYENVSTVVKSNSAQWDQSYSETDPVFSTWAITNSGNYQSSYNTVNSNSANWQSGYSTYNSNSANLVTYTIGDNRYVSISGDVMTGGLSAPSLSTSTLYVGASTIYFIDDLGNTINSLKSNDVTKFNSNYTTVLDNSSNWNIAFNNSVVYATNSSSYFDTTTLLQNTSAANNSVYSTVNNLSAVWNIDLDNSSVNSLVQTNSANWNIAYSAATELTTLSSSFLTNDSSIGDLSDVVLDNLLADQVLTFNGVEWVNRSNVNVSAGRGISYYPDSTSSGVSSYYSLSEYPSGTMENIQSAVANNTTGEVVIDTHITDTLNRTAIEAGTWTFNLWTYVSATAGVSELIARIYKRSIGGTETELFNISSGELTETVNTLVVINTVQPAFALVSTDRLMIRFFAKSTSTSNKTIYYTHNGTNHYTNIQTPLSIHHNDLAGLQGGLSDEYYHLNLTELEYVMNLPVSGIKLDSSYNTVNTNSAINWNYQGTDVKALTANYENISSVVKSNSAQWTVDTDNMSVNNFVFSNSATILDVDSVVQNNSAAWANTTNVLYDSVYTTVNSNSAINWNYQGTDVKELTGNYNSVYTNVNSNSANWNNTYTNFSTQSANNIDLRTTVASNSASWQIPAVYTLSVGALSLNVADGTSLYFGALHGVIPSTTEGSFRLYIPITGTLQRANITASTINAVGSNEEWRLYVRKNSATEELIATVSTTDSVRWWSNNSMTMAVSAGDYVEIRSANPTWGTNPTGIRFGGSLYFTVS